MKYLVDNCPWLNADNLLAAALDANQYQAELVDCWRSIARSDDYADLVAAVALWTNVGVILTANFIRDTYCPVLVK